MSAPTTSLSLLHRAGNPGDIRAWAEFDARYGQLVVRFCQRMGMQVADAEDVRQLVMIRLAQALSQSAYDPQRSRFRTFLGQIVRNEIARYYTRPSRRLPGVSMEAIGGQLAAAPTDEQSQNLWEREWVHHHLRAALAVVQADVGERHYAVFERLLAGEAVAATAAAFNMSIAAVQKVKQRIRERLREQINRQIEAENRGHEAARFDDQFPSS